MPGSVSVSVSVSVGRSKRGMREADERGDHCTEVTEEAFGLVVENLFSGLLGAVREARRKRGEYRTEVTEEDLAGGANLFSGQRAVKCEK